MRSYTFLAVLAAPIALAAPAPVPGPFPKPGTGLVSAVNGVSDIGSLLSALPAVLTDAADVSTAADAVERAIANGTLFGTDIPVVVNKLFQAVQPTATPTSISQAHEWVAGIWGISDPAAPPTPSANALANALKLVLNGFTSSDNKTVASRAHSANTAKGNKAVPSHMSFYNNVDGNAPFSVSEETLRSAIYIPAEFTWGKKQPVIMSPGTGGYGYDQFIPNIGKLLATTDYADPVYLNIPDKLLSDAQVNAEYVAYALQYFHAMTSKKPAIVTWSQGSLDAQWAFKYWPSVPEIVTDHIAISPDYHGTVEAYILCPGLNTVNVVACTPSVLQQVYQSNFVTKLRSNGGDSAYVPTTTVYSHTDEIVQPQTGTAASGYINDARGVGVSNIYLQGSCFGLPAGGLFTHVAVLYNAVAYALVTDALQNDGPGSFDRVSDQCWNAVAPGIGLNDVTATQALIPATLQNIFVYGKKVTIEPELKSYATY